MIQFRDRFCLLTSNNIYLLNSKNDKVSSYHESAFEPSLFSTDLSERMVFFSHFRNRTTFFSSIKQWPSGKTKEWSVFIFWTEEKVSRIYAMQKWLRITLQWIYARKVCHFKSPDLKSDIRCEWEWRFNYLDYSVSQEIATQIEMPRKWHNKNVLYSTHTHTQMLWEYTLHWLVANGEWRWFYAFGLIIARFRIIFSRTISLFPSLMWNVPFRFYRCNNSSTSNSSQRIRAVSWHFFRYKNKSLKCAFLENWKLIDEDQYISQKLLAIHISLVEYFACAIFFA